MAVTAAMKYRPSPERKSQPKEFKDPFTKKGSFSWGAVKKIMKNLLLDGYIITPLPKTDLKCEKKFFIMFKGG